VLIDLGGVLETGCWPGVAQVWAPRLGITPGQLLAAVFGGSDDTVLTGQVSEHDWWQEVRRRLGISPAVLSGVRADIAARWCRDERLLACLARVRGRARTAIVSNSWPHARARLAADGVTGLVDAVVLSCEAGVAKPDRRIFEFALAWLGAEPGSALLSASPVMSTLAPVLPWLCSGPLPARRERAANTAHTDRVRHDPATGRIGATAVGCEDPPGAHAMRQSKPAPPPGSG
jgi:putative hydrolase of the HAD superfamily